MAQLLLLHLLAAALAPWLAKDVAHQGLSRCWRSPRPLRSSGWSPSRPTCAKAALRPSASPGCRASASTSTSASTPSRGSSALLVTGVGALVLLYCTWYFHDDDPTLWRFTPVFTAFAGAMLGLVLTDNFLMLYVFWELTTVLSYLLIGHNPASSTNRRAAMQALLVTTFGGLAMLVGIITIGVHHTYSISGLLADPPPLDAVTVAAVVLLLVGALSKSALVPFHFWLPGAMAAPTPVSAYLHAAAMVKAGIYLVALLAPVFAGAPAWHALTLGLGLLTMIVGGWRALRQHDIKLLLAYGTVSQLGFIVAIAGLGTQDGGAGGAGPRARPRPLQVDALPRRRRRRPRAPARVTSGACPGVGRRMLAGQRAGRLRRALDGRGRPDRRLRVQGERPRVAVGGGAGRPRPFPSPYGYLALAAVVAGSALTVAYTVRFLWGAFATKPGVPPTPVKAAHPGFVLAPLLLGVGVPRARPARAARVAVALPYAVSFPTGAEPRSRSPSGTGSPCRCCSRSSRWPSASLLFVQRELVARVQAGVPALVDGERGFARTLRWVDRGAVETTAVTQRGSLPIYLAGILIVFVALPGLAAVTRGTLPAGAALGQPRRRPSSASSIDRGGGARARHPPPAHGGHARRRDGLRRGAALHPARRPRPRHHPDARRDGLARRLRPRAAPACRRSSPGTPTHPRAPGASASGRRSGRPSAPSRSSPRAAARRRPCRSGSPRRPTTSATARTSSTSPSSTSAPGTPSARCRCSSPPRPASPASSSCAPATPGCPRATSKSLPSSNAARGTWLHGGRTMRQGEALGHLRGRDAARLPHHARRLALPALRRAQPARRRLRRRPRRRSRARRALPRRWPLRARRGGALRRRPARRPRPARRRRLGAGAARLRRHDPRDDGRRLHPVAVGRGAPRDLALLRHRRLPHRHRHDARHRAQPRHRHRPPDRRGGGRRPSASGRPAGRRGRRRARRWRAHDRPRSRAHRVDPDAQPHPRAVVVGLVAAGTALALDRSLVRILLGMVLIGNGVAVLYLVVSAAGPDAPRSSARTRPRSATRCRRRWCSRPSSSRSRRSASCSPCPTGSGRSPAPTTCPTTPRTPASSASPATTRRPRPTTGPRRRRRPPTSAPSRVESRG